MVLTSQCLSFVPFSKCNVYVHICVVYNVKMHADIYVECMSLENIFVGGTSMYMSEVVKNWLALRRSKLTTAWDWPIWHVTNLTSPRWDFGISEYIVYFPVRWSSTFFTWPLLRVHANKATRCFRGISYSVTISKSTEVKIRSVNLVDSIATRLFSRCELTLVWLRQKHSILYKKG